MSTDSALIIDPTSELEVFPPKDSIPPATDRMVVFFLRFSSLSPSELIPVPFVFMVMFSVLSNDFFPLSPITYIPKA